MENNRAIPLLARTLQSRIEEWKSKAKSSEQRQMIELFGTDPQGLKQKLMQFRVLRSYPRLGDALLGDTFDLFKTLKLQLDGLEVDDSKIQETVVQVTYQLNTLQPQTSEALPTIIEGVSGLLAVEFDTVDKILGQHPDWITAELIDQVEERFQTQRRRLTRRFKALRGLIQPSKPASPDLAWDVPTMLTWAAEEYMSYQSWCDAQERFDPELYTIGDYFSQWLMNKWDNIHANSKRMVFNILPNKAAELKRPGAFYLVLVVDNLGWSFSSMLREIVQERRLLSRGPPTLTWAMVPQPKLKFPKKCPACPAACWGNPGESK